MAHAALGSDQVGEFENYTHTSKVYDDRRRPCGMDSLRESLRISAGNCEKKVTDVRLLDCGCGTGNYLNAIHKEVGVAEGLEFNEGMLAQAQGKKMQGVHLEQGSVLDIKRDDASYDAVIMTQVLHHLEAEHHQLAFDEMGRVLAPGGTMWMQTSFPDQIMNGFWWAPIVPQAAAMGASRFPGEPLLRRMLEKAGFEDVRVERLTVEPLMGIEFYADKEGPLSEQYRNGDSTWSRATPEELDAGLAWWKEQLKSGAADAFIKEREAARAQVGQSACVRATRSKQGVKRAAAPSA